MTLHPYDVIMVEGGLAGPTSVIHIAKSNFKVFLIKKKTHIKNIKFMVSLSLKKYGLILV